MGLNKTFSFLLTAPTLDCLFANQRGMDIAGFFEVSELVDVVTKCKTWEQLIFVLVDAPSDAVGNDCVSVRGVLDMMKGSSDFWAYAPLGTKSRPFARLLVTR